MALLLRLYSIFLTLLCCWSCPFVSVSLPSSVLVFSVPLLTAFFLNTNLLNSFELFCPLFLSYFLLLPPSPYFICLMRWAVLVQPPLSRVTSGIGIMSLLIWLQSLLIPTLLVVLSPTFLLIPRFVCRPKSTFASLSPLQTSFILGQFLPLAWRPMLFLVVLILLLLFWTDLVFIMVSVQRFVAQTTHSCLFR